MRAVAYHVKPKKKTVTKARPGKGLPPCSLRSFCEAFNRDRDTVARQVAAAGLAPAGEFGGHPTYSVYDLVQACYLAGDDGRINPDKLRPFERGAYYKAELDKLRLEQELGELVPRLEVEQELARVFKIFAQAFDTTPDRVERETGAEPGVIASVERALDGAREDVHRLLLADEADE